MPKPQIDLLQVLLHCWSPLRGDHLEGCRGIFDVYAVHSRHSRTFYLAIWAKFNTQMGAVLHPEYKPPHRISLPNY